MENATKIDENLNSTAAAIKSSTNLATVAVAGLSVEVRLSILETQNGNINTPAIAIARATTIATATGGSGSLSMGSLDKELGKYVGYNALLWLSFSLAITIGGFWKNHLDHGLLHGWYWFLAAWILCTIITLVYSFVSGELVSDGDEYEYLRKQDRRWCRGKYSCFLIYGARIRHVLQRMKEEEEGKIGLSPPNVV